jgi:endonuclease YncB( thermonuclease family)
VSWIQRGFDAWRRWPLWGKVASVVVLGAVLFGPFIGDESDVDDAAIPVAAVEEPETSTSTTGAPESTTTTSTEAPASTTTTTAVSVTVPADSSTTAAASSTTTTTSGIGGEVATVTNVVDGDTVDVAIDGQGNDTVRLIGINSPEGGECFSAEATAALQALVSDTSIEMTSDQSNRDQYDRLLRYLWLPDGRFVNEELVRGGYAIAREYPPDTAHAIRLEAAQEEAQVAEVGLWAPDACGITPEAQVVISGMHPDAAGNDHENKNDEWVDLTNTGTTDVDMTGWVLKDESATHRYRLPSGFTLEAGSQVRIFTGCSTDAATELYWCNNSAVWNNDGDTAFLLDNSGNIVDSRSY